MKNVVKQIRREFATYFFRTVFHRFPVQASSSHMVQRSSPDVSKFKDRAHTLFSVALAAVSEFENQAGSEDAGLKVDETIKMRVIKLSPEDRKIGLSIRALSSGGSETDWQSYAGSDSPEVTLGDHFKQQTSSE